MAKCKARKLKLNLGSGYDTKKGWCNVDIDKYPGINKLADLSKFPWVWRKGCIDEILMNHFLEHFLEPIKILRECERILKVGGTLTIRSPHALNPRLMQDLTHHRGFLASTFRDMNNPQKFKYAQFAFELIEIKIRLDHLGTIKWKRLVSFWENHLWGVFPINELIVTLKKVSKNNGEKKE